jgi:hypothetical protein
VDAQQASGSEAAGRLRTVLRDALAGSRLSVTQVAQRSALGRTTVSQALSELGPVPSAETVAALARALGLDAGALLELRRAACTALEPRPGQLEPGPGVPIGQCDPLDLEVHPAGEDRGAAKVLPGYVRRAHDEALARVAGQAADGRSALAVLVGSSSTGKTRACWEAIQPLAAAGWRVWHPVDPTRADAALAALGGVGPRTVVWLNETQHYLDAGEALAAALHALLADPGRGPVLVLGTLWPEYDRAYARQPPTGAPDPHARTRELLAGRRIMVPDSFDDTAMRDARRLATSGDRLLAGVLGREHGGRVAQYLAGAPELVRRYQTASAEAKALLHAAMDARRLGVGPHLPLGFLAGAAPGYLHPDAFDALADDWLEQGLAQLAEPVHGGVAPLRRVRERPRYDPPGAESAAANAARGPLYRLADYLEQHGRRERWANCPAASFWHAAHSQLSDVGDLNRLGDAARRRHRLQWADALFRRAADAGDARALTQLAEARLRNGDHEGAESLALLAADAGYTKALIELAEARLRNGDNDRAEALFRRAADAGNITAPIELARLRERAGDREEAKRLALRAVDASGIVQLITIARTWDRAGDRESTEALLRHVSDAGYTAALIELARLREKAGDRQEAEALLRDAADAGDTAALIELARLREKAGDRQEAEALLRGAADAGDTAALTGLARLREKAGDRQEAEALLRGAADAGDTAALTGLARLREKAGDRQEAESLALRAADAGDYLGLTQLAELRDGAGDRDGAERWALLAAERDRGFTLMHLAFRRAWAGDHEGAERLAWLEADANETANVLPMLAGMRLAAGDRNGAENLYERAAASRDNLGLIHLAQTRDQAGDREGAKRFALRAADAGNAAVLIELARRRQHDTPSEALVLQFGLDPDGGPAQPW